MVPKLREYGRQGQAEVVSNSRRKIHQTLPKHFSGALYIQSRNGKLETATLLERFQISPIPDCLSVPCVSTLRRRSKEDKRWDLETDSGRNKSEIKPYLQQSTELCKRMGAWLSEFRLETFHFGRFSVHGLVNLSGHIQDRKIKRGGGLRTYPMKDIQEVSD